ETAPVDIAWTVNLTEVKSYNVVEELHLTRPDSNQQGTVITADQANKVATGRTYQNLTQQVAGVVDVNGGGNPQIKGGNLTMNRYLVDGLDVTDPVTNTFSANINFESLASVEVLTGGMEAQYNSLGGVINLTTNAGGDELHIDASVYVNNAAFSAGSQYGAQLYDSVRPFSTIPRPTTQDYQANLVVGGPLIKKKLWFNVALEYDYTERAVVAGPPLEVQHPARRFNGVLARAKLTWAPTYQHRVTLSASADPAFISNVNQSNSGLGVTENHQNQGGLFAIAQWDWFKSERVNTNVQLGFQYNRIDFGPEGRLGSPDFGSDVGPYSTANGFYDPNRPRHVNNDDGTVWYQGSDVQLDRRYTVQFDPSVSLRGRWLGSHDAKIGLQSRFIYHGFHFERPGGTSYSDAGGGGGESGLCFETSGVGCFQKQDAPTFDNHQWGLGAGLYVQDRWKPLPRLTILPGLRFDWGITKNSVGQTVGNLFGFGPRLGATWDITGDGKTIFSAFYGRSNETLSLLAAVNADVSGTSTTYQWNQATRKFELLTQAGGAGGYLIDKHAATPHADEITFGIRREIFKDSIASVDYTYKRISNIWDGVEVNQVWNPAGTNVVGFVDGQAHQVFRYTTPDQNWRIYQGIDFVFESRPSRNLDLYAAYTLAWLYGPGSEELGQISGGEAGNSQFYNPRQASFYDGFLPEDVRHSLKLRGSYTWHGLVLGAFVRYQTGTPLTKRFFNPYDGDYTDRRSPSGTEPGGGNSANAVAEFRTPDTLQVDVRAAYDFHDLLTPDGRHHLQLIADLFNLFNLANATGIESRDLPTFGTVTRRQQPFRFQIGLRYTY
ncbi:MAG: protein oar, partial [Myxococcales bacterium]|nr:protein oar [Myxococcales bacterium]